MPSETPLIEKPCKHVLSLCPTKRDHCFECNRHLDLETGLCPKGCDKTTIYKRQHNKGGRHAK